MIEAGRGRTTGPDVRPHLLLHAGCPARSARLVRGGRAGRSQYVDSVRINLGLVQPDVDVFWDLAPHDLSILDAPAARRHRVGGVGRQGADPIGAGHACIGYLSLELDGGRSPTFTSTG